MDNDKFQEIVLKHLGEINKHFETIGQNLADIKNRLERIEAQGDQHHEELEKVVSQVESAVKG